jgi:hypothetical protein
MRCTATVFAPYCANDGELASNSRGDRQWSEKMKVVETSLWIALLAAGPVAVAQEPVAAGADRQPEPAFAAAAGAYSSEDFRTLDEEVQELKKLAVDLNRDLFLLEEELLFPANTQVAIFVSMDVGEFFGLDAVEIKVDGKDVTNYLYTAREVDALIRGGVQRLFVGNVKAGEHELVAMFTGAGPHGRDYRRGASLTFEKGIGPKHIELMISDRESKLQPEFVIREWD